MNGNETEMLLALGVFSGILAAHWIAGWSSLVARKAHNLEVLGSNPSPATNFKPRSHARERGFFSQYKTGWTPNPSKYTFKTAMTEAKHLTFAEMEAGLETIRQSPKDVGALKLIVRRPQTEAREILDEAQIDLSEGLVGDNWKSRGSRNTPDGSAHPEMQLNIMNARVIELLAQEKDSWALAGDQLFVDFDLSEANVPPGTRLAIGSAVIEVTAPPHLGCKKFSARFGPDAMKFVNSPTGKELHLRGINAKVVQPGVIRVGNVVKKL